MLDEPTHRNPRSLRPPARTQAALAALAAVVSLLVLGEIGYRAFVPEGPLERAARSSAARSLQFLEPCARVEERDGALRIVADAPADMRVFDLPLDKPDATVRIAVVGESSASMLAAAIERLLERSPSPLPVEVVNCASPGSALEHVERRAAEALTYHPDVLVVAFGHNIEMQYPMDRTRLRLLAMRDRSRLLDALARAWSGMPESAARGPRHTDLGPRIARLEQWLGDLAEQAARRHVLLVPATLGANLWVPPYADRDVLWDPRFSRVRLDYALGDTERAVAELLRLVGDGGPAYWHFTLATWLARQDRDDAAYRQFHLAIDRSDTEPDRAPSAVNDAIRRVASAHALPLRDIERTLERQASAGLPGWDVMSDHCHMQAPLLRAEAAALVRMALERGGTRTDVDVAALARWIDPPAIPRALEGLTAAQSYVSGPFRERWLGALTYAVEQWVRLDRRSRHLAGAPIAVDSEVVAAVDGYLSGPVFASIPTVDARADVLTAIASGYAAADEPERARSLLERAEERQQPSAYVERGLIEVAAGHTAAARAAWTAALELDPGRTDARTFLDGLAAPPESRHE